MTIPTSHKDAVVAHLTEHGEQRRSTISDEMAINHPEVHITKYLLNTLCKEGRLERIRLDTYRARPSYAGEAVYRALDAATSKAEGAE